MRCVPFRLLRPPPYVQPVRGAIRSQLQPFSHKTPLRVAYVLAREGKLAVDDRADLQPIIVEQQKYRRDIDGLRTIAVLLVVVYHAFPEILPGGFIGVDVFFVISGYLISGLLLDALKIGRFSLLHFYNRRIRRIFPPLIAVLIGTIAIGWFQLPGDLRQVGKHVAASAAFVPNFAFWSEVGYFDNLAETKPLLHLWSLGVEEQFYIVWPLVLWAAYTYRWRLRAMIAWLAVASFAISIVMVHWRPEAAFYFPVPRVWELMLGALVAHTERSYPIRLPQLLPIIGLSSILAAAAFVGKRDLFPGWLALLPVLGSALVIAGKPSGILNKVLSKRPLPGIGLISYPLYLWHWPLLSFAFISTGGLPTARLKILAVAAAFTLAIASYLFVEKPVRRGKRPRQLIALLAAIILVGSAGFALSIGAISSGHPEVIQSVLSNRGYNYGPDARLGTCWFATEPTFEDYPTDCFAKPDGTIIWGDSHAARLYPGVRAVLGPSGNIGQFTRNSCPPALGIAYANCIDSNNKILAEIIRSKAKTVILFSAWPNYDPKWPAGDAWDQALRRTLLALREAGIPNIVLIGPAPKWALALPDLVYSAWSNSRHIPDRLRNSLDPSAKVVDGTLRKTAGGVSGVTYVSPLDMLCDDNGCLTHVPGRPSDLLTWDYGHLTTPGATYVASRLNRMGRLSSAASRSTTLNFLTRGGSSSAYAL